MIFFISNVLLLYCGGICKPNRLTPTYFKLINPIKSGFTNAVHPSRHPILTNFFQTDQPGKIRIHQSRTSIHPIITNFL